jgi:UDP-N-acetylmuramoyl-tripeptide--D-alanyl-D-alanine ligase
MIPISVEEIAQIVGGTVAGDGSATVTGPAVLDSRTVGVGGMLVAFAGENADGHDFAIQAGEAGAVAVLGSRATELPTVVVEDAELALQTLAQNVVARLRPELTVIAVTGSQGKTSTKDLLSAVFASVGPTIATFGNLNNELGAPITMLRAEAETRFLVLEMGARYVGDIARLAALAPPNVSIVLNVGKAHLGKFGSQDAIAHGKSELVSGLTPGGTAVLNIDDPRVLAMRSLTDGPVLTYGFGEGADVRVANLTQDALGRPSFDLVTGEATAHVTLPLIGAHQAHNAAAVAAAALAVGVPLDVAATALATVTLTKWRMQLSELANGATLLNDAYNSSPGSARSSLDALAAIDGARRIAVLGQILELGETAGDEHRTLGEYAATKADIVLAVGGGDVPALAEGAGDRAVAVATNEEAIAWLQANLAADDIVLIKASRGARLDEVAAAIA